MMGVMWCTLSGAPKPCTEFFWYPKIGGYITLCLDLGALLTPGEGFLEWNTLMQIPRNTQIFFLPWLAAFLWGKFPSRLTFQQQNAILRITVYEMPLLGLRLPSGIQPSFQQSTASAVPLDESRSSPANALLLSHRALWRANVLLPSHVLMGLTASTCRECLPCTPLTSLHRFCSHVCQILVRIKA